MEDAGRAHVIKYLYGIITSAHAWYEVFTVITWEYGFKTRNIIPCLWYQLAKECVSHDCLSNRVDNFLYTSDKFLDFLEHLKKNTPLPEVHSRM